MATTDYDLIVIGGGINGAGIARDAAMRGLHVLLLEKNDFGSGTSSWSSRLIHGGLRYLEYLEFPLVFESLRERRLLSRNAPHLVRRLPLTIPIYDNSKRGRHLVRLGMIIYDLLSIGKSVPRHRMLSRQQVIDALPALDTDTLVAGARYFDAQVTFAERLVIENVLAAQQAGAVVRNYSPVIGINVRSAHLHSLHYIDADTESEVEVTATVVVNAGGPWVDRILGTVNREKPNFMGGTKGSHIIVGRFKGAPNEALYAEARSDGRPFFIIPWNGQVLIGTTDIRYEGDPGLVTASDEEIDYLLQETNHLFPKVKLSAQHIHFAYAGVRPLPRNESGPASAITRSHVIKKHRVLARGLVSIIGGKLTTFRSLSEETVNYVMRKCGKGRSKSPTREAPLPGAIGINEARRWLAKHDALSSAGRRRLLSIYGGRTTALLELAAQSTTLNRAMDENRTILNAEVAFAIEQEQARTLIDILHRRMMLGLSPGQGREFASSVCDIAAEQLGWSADEAKQQLDDLQTYNDRFTVRL